MECSIAGRKIGPNHAPYIIAEISANHNGSIEKAKQCILAAKHSGADAVKLQTYTADTMTIDCNRQEFMLKGGLWDGFKLYDLYKWAETPYEWHAELFAYAKEIGITVFSTPFDETAVDLLESLATPAYKIASFEITDIPLLSYIAATGKPIIMSTGMATEQEITDAIAAVRAGGCKELMVLHCISSYPAPIEQSNLKTISDIAERYQVVGGLSDHSLGTVAAITAIAVGASIVEKHFTLSRADKGPDSEFSIEPDQFKILCQQAKQAWQALGCASYQRKPAEVGNVKYRRSLYFVKPLKAGAIITEQNVRRIRPGLGLAPKYYHDVLGRRVCQDIEFGTPVSWELIVND